jgi:hypothetical protein
VASLGTLLHELAGPTGTVLEVGAGNGRLAHLLNQPTGGPIAGRVVATDLFAGEGFIGSFSGLGAGSDGKAAGARSVGGGFDGGPISAPEKLSQEEAVSKYQPRVVLSSWMPEEDWTAAWRAHPSVQAYVLLGEADGGQSGRPWPTWGVRPSDAFGTREEEFPPPPWLVGEEPPAADRSPPFEVDGWRRHLASEPMIAEATRWMVGQGDVDHRLGNSTQAVVFTRTGAGA